ncbi:MAG TPA: TetR/AcrR family transcriptional regulator [Spirochaetota bacterium]|nr:TetR/AcrR family transcriptional regulator [Spirochaetota bacterium]HOD14278.1 TetR/AcrR family transcriptional regulator [Spirochaetota bacterium]HPG49274.1 TetR/AcrR family transcriptional regulator [Spirochaetota bacterium]HPN11081.1 TetR/AcrR family transcriptional regulator [Spirochaetota bacterium]HQL84026.1 TetR/AcrR family transcriptional regulator [Spirochaetota bacterium]
MEINLTLEKIRKAQIIEASLRKIAEVGIQNITMDDIAAEARLSKGGIAHYFSSKELLIKETFRDFFAAIFLRGQKTMDQCAGPLDKVHSFMWLYNWEDPLVNIGYPMLFDAMAMAGHDTDYRSLLHEWFDGWIELLGCAVEEGVASGAFPVTDIQGTARAISAIYQGVATRWYLDKDAHSTEWAVSYARKAISSLVNGSKK